MGEVYRAADTTLRRTVALKLLMAVGDVHSREQLLREARTASVLGHPHICAIHDIRQDADPPFLPMEYVAGRPLAAAISPGGLPAATVLRYGAQTFPTASVTRTRRRDPPRSEKPERRHYQPR